MKVRLFLVVMVDAEHDMWIDAEAVPAVMNADFIVPARGIRRFVISTREVQLHVSGRLETIKLFGKWE